MDNIEYLSNYLIKMISEKSLDYAETELLDFLTLLSEVQIKDSKSLEMLLNLISLFNIKNIKILELARNIKIRLILDYLDNLKNKDTNILLISTDHYNFFE